jgi:hypothetical protein
MMRLFKVFLQILLPKLRFLGKEQEHVLRNVCMQSKLLPKITNVKQQARIEMQLDQEWQGLVNHPN